MSVQTEINRINNEVTSQADLIAQIQTALEGKAAVSASGEVSITENGVHDVKQYATANVNVQSAPVLLWTNASPTSAFAAQTVNVASGYDGYLIECRFGYASAGSYEDNSTAVDFIASADTTRHYLAMGNGYTSTSYAIRSVQKSGNAFAFGQGFYRASYNNGNCIPTRIWGVKFTL